jgi:RNA polymerase sigma-70 factor (ECF subfamily)
MSAQTPARGPEQIAVSEGELSPLVAEVAAWFDYTQGPLLRYLSACGLKRAEAEEVVQDVFVAFFDHLRKEKPRDNLRGWLFRTAYHLGLKQVSKGLRRRAVPLQDGGAFEQASKEPDPEQRLARIERRKQMAAVVQAMAPKDRACLVLRAEGLRYREIAAALGISLGSVAVSMNRAIAKLRAGEERSK